MDEYRIIVICFLIPLVSGCNYYWVASYKYKAEDVKYIEEAMNEMFNKYPEIHITQEVLVNYKNAYLNKFPEDSYRIDSLFPNKINTEYIRSFLGKMEKMIAHPAKDLAPKEGYFNIISSKKNIYKILLGYYTTYNLWNSTY